MLSAEFEYFGRLYAAATHVSRAVLRSGSREDLQQAVVRALVEDGKFAMAFIAWLNPETRELVPVARFGDEAGYLDRIQIFAHEGPKGQGPAGAAFRAGTPFVCNDFMNDPRTLPWREAAGVSGWRASGAFPILTEGKPQGLLSVYAREQGFFGSGQVELLRQVAVDVAFGMERLVGEEQRRHAETALAASERRLALALNAAAMGTFEWDPQTGKIVWDAQHERLFGFEPGGFDGTYADFESRVHPEDLPRVSQEVASAGNSESPFSQEFRVVWPDGSEHWIFSQGEFHRDGPDAAPRMYGAVLDITGRKQAEAAMRESEARLRQAVRVSHIGIFDHDHVTGTVYWSQQQRAIHGWSPDEPATLRTYFERIHPDDRGRIAGAVARAHDPAGDGSFDVEHRLALPDGSIRWTSTRSQTFFHEENGVRRALRTVGGVRDITEQKQAEEERKKLAALVAMNRDFAGIATAAGRIVYLNQAALELVGLRSLEEARTKTIFDCFGERERTSSLETLETALATTGHWSGESELRNFETGGRIDVEITAFPIRSDDDASPYLAISGRDISERKRAEAERAELEQQLFQGQKMESIGRLAGGVAHDFNNMLTVINGYSQLVLAKLSAGDPLRDSIEEIHKAGDRAAGLTRQLLAFSRKQVLQPRVLDLNRVVREMLPMLKRLVGEDVEAVVALDEESGTVHADRHQLEQVILNLTVNARQAMPGGGRVSIETRGVELDESNARLHPEMGEGRYVMLAVRDSGIGMDDETRRRIFEPFFTTKPTGEGTGLGLAMVQGIVAQSGGHIDVQSEPGRGTAFRIYLPALADAEAVEETPEAAPALGGSEPILVVEDEEEVRNYAVAALREYGYPAIEAENAEEALALFRTEGERIRLVLTDVVMTGMSGHELAKRLRELRPGLPVVFMSGYGGESVPCIEKPFSPEELAGAVRSALGPSGPAARILVMDDDGEVRGVLRTVLERSGYETVEAEDGEQGLRRARMGDVDVAIVDLVMPVQEGIETILALRRDAPEVGVIAISGAFGGQYLKMAHMLGAFAVLTKPVDAALLLTRVAEALKKRG